MHSYFRYLIAALLFLLTAHPAWAAEQLETIRLQYRIARDAVSPSSFWAVFPGGMSPRVSIDWRLKPEDRQQLDATIAALEREAHNGQAFTAKGIWKRRGFECEIHEIVLDPASPPASPGSIVPTLEDHPRVRLFSGTSADARERVDILKAVATDIEKLKAEFPQLHDFSVDKHLRPKPPSIDYAFRTHAPERTGGWTSGVPSPGADGVWFHIDLHDAGSTLELHTQPMGPSFCLGPSRLTFLLREGRETRSLYGPIWMALSKQGARACDR